MSPKQDLADAQAEIADLKIENTKLRAKVSEMEAGRFSPRKLITFQGQPIMYIAEVEKATAKPRPTIYRESREGTFPKPIQLGKRRLAWLESDINKWIRQRLQQKARW